MKFIKKLIKKYNKKMEEKNYICNKLIFRIDRSLKSLELFFSNKDNFIDPMEGQKWIASNVSLSEDLEIKKVKNLKKTVKYKMLINKKNSFNDIFSNLEKEIKYHNNIVSNNKIYKAYEIIGNIEGNKLDEQQMKCIVKEIHNHLVIAGAGTGKTTTVVGKVKYLLNTYMYKPEDILVISFTNTSALEMKKRIYKETGKNIEAITFHKLGLNIITSSNGIKPKITQLKISEFIKKQLNINMKSDSYLWLLSSYLLYSKVCAKSEFEFEKKEEYDEYLKLNPPTTFKNEIVKSYGEMDIANFLMQNGIDYIYEKSYEFDTRTKKYSQYYPDFYLPKYNIYIEYFGINRKGEVPSYFKESNGLSATKVYQDSIKWKRQIHKKYNTIMIECYAYEKFEGKLLDNLKDKLIKKGVLLSSKSGEELWNVIKKEENTIIDSLTELFGTLINLIKNNGYDINTVRNLINNDCNASLNRMLLNLLEPIFNAYQTYLIENNEIDFNDMINNARECILQGKYVNSYKYVIVDEYQDISKSCFSLLKTLRNSSNFDLFCVGDDWQSIYRFAGSDIGFILNFEKYWGASEISKIETTYRFTQKLIEISSNFIMKNPSQIKKFIRGNNDSFIFPLGEINGFTDNAAFKFMLQRIDDIPDGSSIFFIGRYLFDRDILINSGIFSYRYNNDTGFTDIFYSKRPKLKMSYLTAHKSKGLQADYVFIINNKNFRMGFPSKIQNTSILNLLLDSSDLYPYGEERRLFYVALTRAKKKVYILTVKRYESEFALELREKYNRELKYEHYQCPVCGGKLIKIHGQYGDFYGCSNYKNKGCIYKKKI